MKDKKIYKIIFIQLGEIYEIFAKQIFQSDMYGFLEVEEFIFTNDDQLVVDPSSEKLKTEFNKVKRSYIPIGAIQRIDEVIESGEAKIKKTSSQASPFPLNIQPAKKTD
tara:strand:- start:45 stop:371 length:327 start_codon:yes stop_codon:yes gene_type:complete